MVFLSFYWKKASSMGKEAKAEKAGVTSTQAAEDSTQRSTEVLVTVEETDGFGQSSDQLSNSLSSPVTNAFSSSEESGVQPAATEDRGSDLVATLEEEFQAKEQDISTGASELDGSLVEAEIHATLEMEEKEPPSSSEWRDNEEEEDNDEEDSRKENYSEGDLVDVSAYSGPGEEEDSAGSQLDDEDDEEDEEPYQPESSCSEIPGLPTEEEPVPPSRKIRFSTEPIKVSWMLVAGFSQFFVFHFTNQYFLKVIHLSWMSHESFF